MTYIDKSLDLAEKWVRTFSEYMASLKIVSEHPKSDINLNQFEEQYLIAKSNYSGFMHDMADRKINLSQEMTE